MGGDGRPAEAGRTSSSFNRRTKRIAAGTQGSEQTPPPAARLQQALGKGSSALCADTARQWHTSVVRMAGELQLGHVSIPQQAGVCELQ